MKTIGVCLAASGRVVEIAPNGTIYEWRGTHRVKLAPEPIRLIDEPTLPPSAANAA